MQEKNQKEEQVVDAQGFFDEIACEKLERFIRAEKVVDQSIE